MVTMSVYQRLTLRVRGVRAERGRVTSSESKSEDPGRSVDASNREAERGRQALEDACDTRQLERSERRRRYFRTSSE